MEELGGPRVHGRNGVVDLTVDEEPDAAELARAVLGLLPQRIGAPPPRASSRASRGDPGSPLPAQAREVYDVREVAGALVDGGELIELSPRWAPNMVTALCRVDGRPAAIVANQPRSLGGIIDAAAAEKAARFVERCDRLRLPLLVLVDTPGFMPGRKQEAAGVIRHGANLLRAFAGATVPKITVVLRKAYGGAVITMNSRDLGADVVFAWPRAEIGIMAAGQAVDIVHRRALEANGNGQRQRLASDYAEQHLSAPAAAASGFVDEVIEPSSTRDRVARTLLWLEGR
jgi:acetyl-CoA carboxylase carboxyltransferase component